MTIAQTATTSFKVELLQAVHDFGPITPDTFKLALYTAAANLGPNTTIYTTAGEVPRPQSEQFTAAATQVLRMVVGLSPIDLYYDLNGDGVITLVDAEGFSNLAAGIPLGYTPNSASIYTAIAATNTVGYTAGGNTLTSPTVLVSGTTAYVDFADTAWASATFTARGALIYNASKGNKAVAVLDFGADKTAADRTFTVVFPAADPSSAIVRIS